jgi:hypothetical protein
VASGFAVETPPLKPDGFRVATNMGRHASRSPARSGFATAGACAIGFAGAPSHFGSSPSGHDVISRDVAQIVSNDRWSATAASPAIAYPASCHDAPTVCCRCGFAPVTSAFCPSTTTSLLCAAPAPIAPCAAVWTST